MTSAPTDKTSLSRTLTLAMLAGAAFVTAVLASAPARAEDLIVKYDQSQLLRLPRAASEIIIGNPAIADVTIQDNQTLIITGRSFGTTNLIVLDAAGQAIADETVVVAASDEQVVTVYRRASRQTFSCTPDCSPTLAIGDNQKVFDSVTSQIQAHGGLSDAAANK